MKKSKDKVKKPEPAKTETTTRGEIYDWMQSLVFALIICILVFVFLFRIVDVSGDSMNPTLTNGDKLVVSDVFYKPCLLYTSPSPRDRTRSRMPSSA